jgi:hypothetical protein
MGPTALLPLRRKACWGFFRPKNPTALAGCEPANLGTKGQHAASRSPKPLFEKVNNRLKVMLLLIALEVMFPSRPRVYILSGSFSCGTSFLLNLTSEVSLQLQWGYEKRVSCPSGCVIITYSDWQKQMRNFERGNVFVLCILIIFRRSETILLQTRHVRTFWSKPSF